MKKYTYKLIIFVVVVIMVTFSLGNTAHAMAPSISIVNGVYDSTQVTVWGDSNAPVALNYTSYYQAVNVGIIGYTNNVGYFSGQIYPTTYNIPTGSQIGVTVNGQMSNTVLWQNNNHNQYPDYAYNNGTPLSLNQTNISLRAGETQTVTISGNNNNGNYYNYYTTNLYQISSTSNTVVTSSLNGNTVTLFGKAPGTATLTVCPTTTGYSYQATCVKIYVIVQANYYSNYSDQYINPINSIDTHPQVMSGSVTTARLGNFTYENTYRVISSKPYVAQAVIRGSDIMIFGYTPGASDLIICANYTNECFSLFVTVNPKIAYSNTYPYNSYNNWYYHY